MGPGAPAGTFGDVQGGGPGAEGKSGDGGDAGPAGRPLAVAEGLFTLDDPPRLLAGHCAACGQNHFPAAADCPYCAALGPEPVALDGAGRLWAWTAVTAAPPGYRGPVPYGFGVVELDAGIRVLGRLTVADPGALSMGQAMELVLDPLHRDDAGRTVVTYAFAPAGSR